MKKCFRISSLMLIILLAVAFTSCDEPMMNQMDTVIDPITDTPPTESEAPLPEESEAPLPEEGTVVFVEPRQVISPAVGQQLQVRINIERAVDVAAYEVTVGFDPTALAYVSIANADYLPAGAFAALPQVESDNVYLAVASPAGAAAGENGTLAIVTFEVVAAKASTITLSDVLLLDSNVTPLTSTPVDGKVSAP